MLAEMILDGHWDLTPAEQILCMALVRAFRRDPKIAQGIDDLAAISRLSPRTVDRCMSGVRKVFYVVSPTHAFRKDGAPVRGGHRFANVYWFPTEKVEKYIQAHALREPQGHENFVLRLVRKVYSKPLESYDNLPVERQNRYQDFSLDSLKYESASSGTDQDHAGQLGATYYAEDGGDYWQDATLERPADLPGHIQIGSKHVICDEATTSRCTVLGFAPTNVEATDSVLVRNNDNGRHEWWLIDSIPHDEAAENDSQPNGFKIGDWVTVLDFKRQPIGERVVVGIEPDGQVLVGNEGDAPSEGMPFPASSLQLIKRPESMRPSQPEKIADRNIKPGDRVSSNHGPGTATAVSGDWVVVQLDKGESRKILARFLDKLPSAPEPVIDMVESESPAGNWRAGERVRDVELGPGKIDFVSEGDGWVGVDFDDRKIGLRWVPPERLVRI